MAPRRQTVSDEATPFSVFDLDRLQREIGVLPAIRVVKHLLQRAEDLPTLSLQDDRNAIPFAKLGVSERVADFIRRHCVLFTLKVVLKSESKRGGDTIKLLIELQDGHRIETVVMKHAKRSTVCVSSQIGCQMGCRFCATGTLGIIGNLTAGEIVQQVVLANSFTRIRNCVFMGMGEPLNNFENVKTAIAFLVNDKLLALSARHVTVSTVGVLAAMKRLTLELPAVNLALSLHAPNQRVRRSIVPAAAAHPIDKLMRAVDEHIAANPFLRVTEASLVSHESRRATGVMIEYILIKEVNDRVEHAHELGALLAPRRGHVLLNLIPYNPTDVTEAYAPPESSDVDAFYQTLVSSPYFILTRIRREMGQDISGACGQLALKNDDASLESSKERVVSDIEDGIGGNVTAWKREGKRGIKAGRAGGEGEKDDKEDILKSSISISLGSVLSTTISAAAVVALVATALFVIVRAKKTTR